MNLQKIVSGVFAASLAFVLAVSSTERPERPDRFAVVELGSIEEGKRASLIITDGDPLEIRMQIRHIVIDGEITPLDNKHLELYEKYRARP